MSSNRRLRVLLVDDDPEDLELATDALQAAKRTSFDVTTSDPEGALDRLQNGAFDVALIDYSMGSTDGLSLLKEARDAGCAVPVVLFTGYDDESLAEAALAAGVMDYLEKHRLEPVLLERTLTYAVERDRAYKAVKQMEENLQSLVDIRTQELSAAHRELEGVSYAMSHDMRAPVRAILATSASLMEESSDLSVEIREGLLRQSNSASRMHALVEALIRYLRLVRAPLKQATLDISTMAHDIVDTMGRTDDLSKVSFIVAPGLTAFADLNLTYTLLGSLMDNAVKFTDPERPNQIHIRPGALYGEICVEDSGIGFDQKFSKKVFEPFERLHRDADYPGVGIGLALARRAVSRQNGTISLDSNPGQGTTVCFTLGPPVPRTD